MSPRLFNVYNERVQLINNSVKIYCEACKLSGLALPLCM